MASLGKDPVGDWTSKRNVDSIDSALGVKGVTPAWSLNDRPVPPILVGDSPSTFVFSPVRPAQAQTPFDPPVIDGLGKQHQSAHGMERFISAPAFNFYG